MFGLKYIVYICYVNYKIIIMKRKIFSIGAALAFAFTVTAQTEEVTNKNGVVVTPEAGDWAIGFDASPLLNYAGNLLNGNTSNSMNTQFIGANQAIFGKYFVDASTAYRGGLRIASLSGKQEILTDTNTVNSNPSYVTDIAKSSGAAIYLSAGIEKRRGKNRLQGYYGGEATIMFGGSTPNMSYEYGATLDSANIADGAAVNGRTLTSKAGSTFGFGVRGFIGAEYFFMPKMSISAEYGWGLMFSSTGAGETVTENYGLETSTSTAPSTYEVTTMTGKSSSFGIDTDNMGGVIRLMFHF